MYTGTLDKMNTSLTMHTSSKTYIYIYLKKNEHRIWFADPVNYYECIT